MNFTSINLGVLTGAMIALLWIVSDLRNDDMTICQLSHSYDVCFQALNR